MKWWNDLWLNESFADCVNYIIMEDMYFEGSLKTKFSDPRLHLNNYHEPGYALDQEISSHPIATKVKDIFTASSIFDGITYCKGAAVMTQLYH